MTAFRHVAHCRLLAIDDGTLTLPDKSAKRLDILSTLKVQLLQAKFGRHNGNLCMSATLSKCMTMRTSQRISCACTASLMTVSATSRQQTWMVSSRRHACCAEQRLLFVSIGYICPMIISITAYGPSLALQQSTLCCCGLASAECPAKGCCNPS